MNSNTTPSNTNVRNEEGGYVVGIGASAGGLEALQKMLSAMPSNTGFPYIVVQHLAPDYKSLLSEILSKYTEMPVVQVEDGMEIRPNCVYVIPPRNNMILSGGRLQLVNQKNGELNLPIDIFFRSLAEEAGTRAIAIVLSGTGSDGTNGIRSIKENDGMIIVQSPESSKFDGMPRSAIRTGLVDAQFSPEEIALELQHIAVGTQNGNFPPKTERQIDDDLMKRIYVILKNVSGVNFIHYKQSTILRRIERRMMLCHKDALTDYVDYLYEFPNEAKVLSKEVLIGVTNFFREPEFFESLKEKAIKNIVLHSSSDDAIRVWVAGCSTGEEAYSIAILFYEVMESLKIKREVKIFATDLDVEAVTTAGKGVYSDSITNSVSAARLSRYFTRRNNTFVVNRDIRKSIVFSPHNVFQDPPFGRLDLISCRNLLIYFQAVLQSDLFAIFHSALKDGAYLFLDKSEAVGSYTEAFPVVDAAAKIFSHNSGVKIPGAKTIPFLKSAFADGYGDNDDFGSYRKRTTDRLDIVDQNVIDTALLERFMPSCLVINERNELVHTYGDTTNLLHFSVGKVSNVLFDVVTESLKIPISTILKDAREKHTMVQYKDIHFSGEHEKKIVNLTASVINKKTSGGDTLYALVFTDAAEYVEPIADAVPYEIDQMASQRITDLEQELSDVQQRLNRSVTEQECVNEELQAANEELLTANEELQSSNEELQSVNEELYTVNSEYQNKLAELADMNDDITNFLATTLIGIIFVDSKLNLRRFTNYVATEFSVMEQDIGRPINFISYHFPNVDIAMVCDKVIKTLMPDERELITNRDKAFFMRVSPYRTIENKILGCVITIMDVTMQKQGQVMLQSTEKMLSLAQQASNAKSDFLSRMSHEIRTPMNALAGLADLAQEQLEDKASLHKSLDQITDTVKYMTSIVSDILEMSKIERSEVDLLNEPFALRAVINKVLAIVSPRMNEQDLTFNISVPDKFASAYIGDETRVQQILINFLTNAMKFTPKGGVVTFMAYEEARVGTRSTLCFIISDTGIGIGKEFVPDMFLPFTREGREDAPASSSSSMGLGLSIAYNLIKLMNGDVSVKSEEGSGSTFTIHIQLAAADLDDDQLAASKSYTPLENEDLNGCHLLIAEDNDVNRSILESLLAHQGATFVAVRDGSEAVATFTSSPEYSFDCILMDMRMPKVDGMKAALMIRNSEKADSKTVPIIAVSANAFSDDIKKADMAGISDYITKPIDSKKMFKTINRLCKAHKDKPADKPETPKIKKK